MSDGDRISLKTIVALGAAAAVIMVLMDVFFWSSIPGGMLIPIHWGIYGQPDGFAPKPFALFCLPVIVAIVTTVYWIYLKPHVNSEIVGRASGFIYATWGGVSLLLLAAQWLILLAATGKNVPVPQTMLTGIGILLLIAGKGSVKHPELNPYLRGEDITEQNIRLNKLSGIIIVAMGVCVMLAGALNQILFGVCSIVTGVVIVLGVRLYGFITRPKTS